MSIRVVRGYNEINERIHRKLSRASPVGAFPHAKRVGELLILSGIGPRTRGSKEIPGVGREGGEEALRFFTEPKNVCIAK